MTEYPVPVTDALLQGITQKIVDTFDPEKVILFGSHASDTPHADSDIDLLVVMEADGSPIQRAVELKRACRPRFVPMDVLVKTPEEVASRLQHGSFFLRQVLEQGRVLYERQPCFAQGGGSPRNRAEQAGPGVLGHGFHETAQGVRFTISEPARREVLTRLLELNHERNAEEVRQGLHEKKGKKNSRKGETARRKRVDDRQISLF